MTPKTAENILKELIAIPSLNPGDSDNLDWIGENRMAKWLETYLGGLGFTCSKHLVWEDRPNLLARIGAAKPTRSLMIEGHMDTVAVDNMVIPPFEPEIRDGKMYGRGSCDTKGPSAAALAGFTPLVLEAAQNSDKQLLYIGAVAEEVGCHGAHQLANAGIGADEAVILEPTSLKPVTAHKTSLWIRCEFSGKAGHASEPEHGINAADRAIAFAYFMRDLVHSYPDTHPLLGKSSFNLGVIQAGQAANIIPNQCSLEIDMRLVPSIDPQPIIEAAREFLAAQGAPETEADIACETAFSTEADTELIQRLLRSCAATGVTSEIAGAPWYSDAGPLAQTCPQICVFGPGSIRQAHTKDEWIDLAELQKGAEIFETLYLDFLQS